MLNSFVQFFDFQENRLCIGQKKVGAKNKEITTIPELLEQLEIAGSTVTIDAIGCQGDIAQLIIDKEADYLLAIKQGYWKNWKIVFDFRSSTYEKHLRKIGAMLPEVMSKESVKICPKHRCSTQKWHI